MSSSTCHSYACDDYAWVGLGSNLGDSARTLYEATERLKLLSSSSLLKSSQYITPPWGLLEQPQYLNQVVGLIPSPHLTPETLLDELLDIESSFGRIRSERWGPRTLDLDLLSWGDYIIQSERLIIPHPRLTERRFVLEPWCELAAHLRLPNQQLTLDELLQLCPDKSILKKSI